MNERPGNSISKVVRNESHQEIGVCMVLERRVLTAVFWGGQSDVTADKATGKHLNILMEADPNCSGWKFENHLSPTMHLLSTSFPVLSTSEMKNKIPSSPRCNGESNLNVC